MLDRIKHETVLKNILKDIYKDVSLSQKLIFKGGTASYLFYDLPRFSVDLDFDLKPGLSGKTEDKVIVEHIKKISHKYAMVEEGLVKRFTVLVVLAYQKESQKIKIEVSKRAMTDRFELVDFYGVGVAVMPRELMLAEKLAAITGRSGMANRDIFDVNYFLKQGWDFDKEHLKLITKKEWRKYFKDCIKCLQRVNQKKILDGLGQMLDMEQREWVRKNLIDDTIFQLKVSLDRKD